MRRRAAVVGLLPLALLLPACGAPTTPGPAASAPVTTAAPAPVPTAPTTSTSAAPSATPSGGGSTAPEAEHAQRQPGTCAAVVAGMSLSEQVGQTIMVAQSSTTPSAAGRDAVRRLHLGSVVLLGNSTEGHRRTADLTGDLRDGVGKVDGVGLLVAADQEGGLVQRLKGPGFDTIPRASTQAGWSDATLRKRAKTWSEQLGRAGVDLNLAPVADVVPSSVGNANEPIGALHRGFGPQPAVVARKSVAVLEGMHDGGTATAVKHFPGLGRVRGNTDTRATVVDATTTRDDALLAGFRADVEHGTELVMLSSATYRRIDAKRPATYSPTVIEGMLRGDLGFRGVVVSDDLLGRALASTSVRSRGVRFLEAGGDLALVGSTSAAAQVHDGLLERARSDRAFRARVEQSATRVVAMKSGQDLVSCRVTG
ncbi:glycoside hydrolase family 3 protein [Microlunatus antarcticus]|uniref:beta-N-acetylhexosaminidase n=1 Tax=Microlunatus antarcticus TaxID=53388 RepID=A0A7W5JWS0_9ACTN|nr:beta-N-acetylhexosaminidase [Microlunatus antarcticus]